MARELPIVRRLAALALLFLPACAVGPREHVPAVVPAATQLPTPPGTDRAFFDSLSRAAALPPPALAPGAAFSAQGADAVAWLDVIHDTTLARLVTSALRNNRNVQVALARVDEYRALVGSARSQLFPAIGAQASAAKNQVVYGNSPPTPYRAWQAAVTLQWEVDFWGRIRKGLAAAEASRDAQADDERALVLTLVADVSDAYLGLLEAREDLALSQRTLASRQATLELVRQRFRQGSISELDVRQFEADVASAAASVAQFTRAAAQQEHGLSLLLGEAPGPVAPGGFLDSTITSVAVPDSVPASLLLRRPDVLRAERQLAAATAQMGATIASVLPRFTITGQYGRQSPTTSDLFGSDHEIYTLQAGVSVPLFAGGRQTSELDAARARIAQARGAYEQQVLVALNEAANALIAVRTYRDQLAAQEAEAVALRSAQMLAERRYEGGVASYLEVLDAERSLFGAELALGQARRAYLEGIVTLYKALGGRWGGTP